ncbi:MAG: carbohydrate ABC transporter substrate-binding protein [Ruminococcus sp.]|nr:carbohydrate ABC transporter substrate-binding protein [Ruminococcus sp.]
MMKAKRALAFLVAVMTAAAITGCGSSDSSSGTSAAGTDAESTNEYDLGSHEDAVSVTDTETIASMDTIPDSEKELIWLSYFDINPTRSSPETRTDLDLFQKKGGKIIYDKTQSLEKYTKLAQEILAGSPPDMFWFEKKMTFPYNVTRGMFQSIDSIVDFDSDLWKDTKDDAEEYVLNGQHFVAPIRYVTTSVITYDKDVMEAAELDDPYTLWQEGKWNWNTWYDMMAEYVNNAPDDEQRYGVNGWFAPFIFYSTGKSLIMFDKEKQEYYNNIDDSDFIRVTDMLYDIKKNGFYLNEWRGQTEDAFTDHVLFYAMGPWASIDSHTPKEGDRWAMVPLPSDPNSDKNYIYPDIEAYMWVAGSKKDVAMKTWLECARIVNTDEQYKQVEREKFFTTNPNWTDEMYYVAYELLGTDYYTCITDPGFGVNTDISDDDAALNDSKEAVNSYMYTSVMKESEDGEQFTWTQLKESYRDIIDKGVSEINELYKEFMTK